MSAVGCVPDGALFSRSWGWLPATVAVFAAATLMLNLFAVPWQREGAGIRSGSHQEKFLRGVSAKLSRKVLNKNRGTQH